MYLSQMRTTVTERGQTAIPAQIRRHFGIRPGQKLEWVENGGGISVIPSAKDPVRSFRGSSKGWGLTQALLKERRADARRV